MPICFFAATHAYRKQHTALFDFIHPVRAAIWNTRWQVQGFLAAAPQASKNDLDSRFLAGSGITGANLKRAFAEHDWAYQQEQLAKFALINIVAFYEGWLAEVTSGFPAPKARQKALQFPSAGVSGRTDDGVGDAIAVMTQHVSPVMERAFTPVLRNQAKYRRGSLDQLLLIYRYFKEARNAIVHNGGTADAQLCNAETAFRSVTSQSSGLKQIPEAMTAAPGGEVLLSLRGVIGFCEVVYQMVTTIDAELSASTVAEHEFVRRWKTAYTQQDLMISAREPKRSRDIVRKTVKAGFPEPAHTAALERFLLDQRLIF